MPSIEEISQSEDPVQLVAGTAIAPLEEKSIQIQSVKDTLVNKETTTSAVSQKPKDTGPRLVSFVVSSFKKKKRMELNWIIA